VSWIVLDPEPDIAIASGFSEAEEAVAWVKHELDNANTPERIALLQRVIVAPFDPGRDA
jgi:hypothetical protein